MASNKCYRLQKMDKQTYSIKHFYNNFNHKPSSSHSSMPDTNLNSQIQIQPSYQELIDDAHQIIPPQPQPQKFPPSFQLIVQQLQTTSSASNTYLQHWQHIENPQYEQQILKVTRMVRYDTLLRIQRGLRQYQIEIIRSMYLCVRQNISMRVENRNERAWRKSLKNEIQKQIQECTVWPLIIGALLYLGVNAFWLTLSWLNFRLFILPQHDKTNQQTKKPSKQIPDNNQNQSNSLIPSYYCVLWLIQFVLLMVSLVIMIRVYMKIEDICYEYSDFKYKKKRIARFQDEIKQKELNYNFQGMPDEWMIVQLLD